MAKYLREFWLLRAGKREGSILYSPDVKFRDQTRCVMALFERNFGKLENKEKCWRMIVNFSEDPREKELTHCEIIHINIKRNVDSFYTLEPMQKKVMALELLKEGYERVVDLLGYPREQFDKAYQAVKDCEYINNWIWKRKFSPDRKTVAEISCEHEVEYFRASIIVKDKKGKLLDKVHLFDIKPHEFAFNQYLGGVNWISNDTIEYVVGRRKQTWTYNLPSKKLDFQGEPLYDFSKS